MATGRSDHPNQINKVLAFPGIFRGALDVRARAITEEMKIAAARGIAATVADEEQAEDYIIPSVFSRDVSREVARAVADEAQRAGPVREPTTDTAELSIPQIPPGAPAPGPPAAPHLRRLVTVSSPS